MTRTRIAERVLALLMLGLALILALGAIELPSDAGYAGLSARFVPLLLAPSAALCAVLLLRESITGGFRHLDEAPQSNIDVHAAGWLLAGVCGAIALMQVLGFVASCTLVMSCVGHALRQQQRSSARVWLANAGAGAALGVAALLLFRGLLGVNLPVLPLLLGY